MIETMYIGSGDVKALMQGKDTAGYLKLWQRFLSNQIPHHNAKASPIDALRTGAILEDRYFLRLDDSYFSQYHVRSDEMDVFKASLDFAKLHEGKIVDFIELKCIMFDDIISLSASEDRVEYVKKNYKEYYNQVQEQLYCTGLPSASLEFVAVYTHNDEENHLRLIQDGDVLPVRIERDEYVISQIKERGVPFQYIKDYFFNQ